MKKALVIRHHEEDHPGLIGDALVARGYEIDLAMLNAASETPSVTGVDVVVVLGSKCAVYDHEVETAWFGRELELLAHADRLGVPILGICFGAQALCRLFGGEVSRANVSEVGWYEIEVSDAVPLPAGPWFEYHFDSCSLPKHAEVWATSRAAVQAFAVGPHVGVQFHPEIDEVQLAQWLAADPNESRDLGIDPTELLAQTARETPAARQRAQALVDLFLSRTRPA